MAPVFVWTVNKCSVSA